MIRKAIKYLTACIFREYIRIGIGYIRPTRNTTHFCIFKWLNEVRIANGSRKLSESTNTINSCCAIKVPFARAYRLPALFSWRTNEAYFPDDDTTFMANYAINNILEEFKRIPGVSEASIVGNLEYAIRVG